MSASLLADLRHDLRLALRNLARSPSQGAVAVLVLGLGLGAVTAVASLLDAVLLRPLPYDHPERIAYLWQAFDQQASRRVNASVPELMDYEQRSRTLEAIGGLVMSGTSLSDEREAERVQLALVTPGFLAVLGVQPARGRVFTADEAKVPFAVYALLSDRIWRRRFAADPAVVGRVVRMGGRQVTVLGVMPPGFAFPAEVDVWRPLVLSGAALTDRSRRFIDVLVRTRPGVAIATASRDVDAAEQGNPEHGVARTWLEPLREHLSSGLKPALLLVGGAVLLVLLIACANVAHLALVRAAGRRREIAVRCALGASRWRLARQLVAESLVLATAGAALGIALAHAALLAVGRFGPGEVLQLRDARIDPRVLAVTLAATLLSALLAGLAPAWSGTRIALSAELTGVRATGGRRARRVRSGLVVLEVALSLMLLIGASLLTRTLLRLRDVPLGFREDGTLTLSVSLPFATYPEQPRRVAFFAELLRRVRALPGVTAAGAASILPMSGVNASSSAVTEATVAQGNFPEVNVRSVTAGYLETLGVPLLEGRMLNAGDGADTGRRVVVLNAAAARRLWSGQRALGRLVSVNAPPDRPEWREVVGVVGDMRQAALDAAPQMELYEPHPRTGDGLMSLAVHTRGEPLALVPAIRGLVRSLDPELPVFDVKTLSERLGASIATRRFAAMVLSVFSGLALVLATVGLYGVVAFSVAQRTREIGVRLALGARRADVGLLVLRGGLGLTLVGVLLGTGLALLLTRLIRGMLFEVSSTDPLSYGGVAALLLAVAGLASWIPARRAAALDPVKSLREES